MGKFGPAGALPGTPSPSSASESCRGGPRRSRDGSGAAETEMAQSRHGAGLDFVPDDGILTEHSESSQRACADSNEKAIIMAEMVYRRFGRTELKMPVLTCGGMRFQQGWQDIDFDEITDESQQNVEATILKALEAGINHIETARGYGCSERQLGRILPTLPRDEIIVQTKVGPKETGEAFLRDFETSMARLQLDYVDMLGIHGINTDDILDMTLREGGTLDVAKRLVAEGRVRHLGFSTHGPTSTIVKAIETDEFEYVNLHWYWIDQVNQPAIDAATARDMGVFIISPNDKGGKLYAPPPKLVDLCSPLTPMGFNDLFCLWHENVHTLSIGVSRPEDFDAHLDIVPLLGKQDELLRPILSRLKTAAETALGRDWTEGWHVGLPPADTGPGQVNLYHVLRLYTVAKAYDMLEFGKMRYNLFGNGGHWFAGNKVDKLDWDGLADAIAGSPVAGRIPDALREAHAMLNAEEVKRLSESDEEE